MAKISSTIELQDKMSIVLNRINQSLNAMNVAMTDVNDNVAQGFDDSQVDAFRSALDNANVSARELIDIINNVGDGAFGGLTQGAMTFASTIGTVAGNIITHIAGTAFNAVTSIIDDSISQYKESENAMTQLAATLSNTSDDAVNSFDRVLDKAQQISEKGMYSQDAMIAAGAEFATYFSDNDAMDLMMDTLTDYAAGMSGGGAIDNKQMVDYATNIAKLTTGAYDAMTKKGFEVTDAQKAILQGTATQSQLVQELGADYVNMSEDMQKATVINGIIAESWNGMYEAMSQTPEGQILSLTNKFQDLMQVVGGELLSSFNQVYSVIDANWDTVKMIIQGISSGIRVIISTVAIALDYILKGIQIVSDFFDKHGQAILTEFLSIMSDIIGAFNVVKTFITNVIADLQALFWGFFEVVTNIVLDIANTLNKLPFIEIDVSGLERDANEYKQLREDAWNSKTGYGEAFQNGKDFVYNLADNIGSFIQNATAPLEEHSYFGEKQNEIAKNTEATVNALNKNSEELEYLKDFAEQEVINRFTTAEIRVDMGGISQNISKDTDADGVVDYLVTKLESSMSAVAEGVYA